MAQPARECTAAPAQAAPILLPSLTEPLQDYLLQHLQVTYLFKLRATCRYSITFFLTLRFLLFPDRSR